MKSPFLKIALISFFSVLTFTSSARADLISTETCYVRDNTDDASSPFSLRSAADDYNVDERVADRACTQNIYFQRGSFEIRLSRPLDFTGLGNLRVDKKDASRVILNGTSLSSESCVIDLRHKRDEQKITLSGIEIVANRYEEAICGTQYTLDATHPVIIHVGSESFSQACIPSQDSCCSETGSYLEVNAACTTNTGRSGFCLANHSCFDYSLIPYFPVFIPSHPADCEAGALCCDAQGHFQSAGSSCTLRSGQEGTCNASGICMETPAVSTAVCGNGNIESGEACDGGSCCSPSCTPKTEGSACELSGQSGTCDSRAQCIVTPSLPETPSSPASETPAAPTPSIPQAPSGNSNTGNEEVSASGGCSLSVYN